MRDKLSDEELLSVIKLQKDSAYEWRERRHPDWDETYMLYRDKVIVNRLTQRQTMNVPLMKMTVQTLLKDVDEPPMLYFDSLDNDDQAEIFYNEVWKYATRENKLILKDIVDKKQVLLFGRSFKKMNIVDGKFFWEVIDPKDVLVDRFVDPTNLDTARFLCHTNIFKPLSALEEVEEYSRTAIAELKRYYEESNGIAESTDNMEHLYDKSQRMRDLGVDDVENPLLGETYVELNENYMYLWCEEKKQEVLHLITTAADEVILLNKPLHEVIGDTSDDYWCNHLPWNTWASDPERTDFWSDGVGDVIRGSNRFLNSMAAGIVENRTLRNFNMHYYNATTNAEGDPFMPETWTPQPWGWYGVPGNPNEIIKDVEVADLSDSLDEMNLFIGMAEKATAATAAQQGQVESRQVTLGEVQMALANAKERVKSLEVFYNDAWEDFGVKYTKMLEAASDVIDDVTITKKGRRGLKMYTRTITTDDYLTEHGYKVEVRQVKDKSQEDVEQIQKLQAVSAQMPDNQPLQEIYKKKLLEFAALSLTEMDEVMEFEKEKAKQMQQDIMSQLLGGGSQMGAMPPGQPQQALPAQAGAPQMVN